MEQLVQGNLASSWQRIYPRSGPWIPAWGCLMALWHHHDGLIEIHDVRPCESFASVFPSGAISWAEGQGGGGKRGEPPHPLPCIEESQEENMLPETPG